MKTHKQLIKILCQKEGKKSQVSRGNVMEVIRCLRELIYENPEWLVALLKKGK